MKAVKIILGMLVVAVAIFFGYGATLPTEYHLKRDVRIAAPVEVVFPQVNNLQNATAWSPWAAKDPTLKNTYSGPEAGEGATQSWTSENSGEGKQTITKSVVNERIESHLDFGKMGQADAWFDFVPMDGETHVTWGFHQTIEAIPFRYFGMQLEDMLGPDYEDGLRRLKTIAEALPIPEMPADVSGAVTDATGAATDVVPGDGMTDEAGTAE